MSEQLERIAGLSPQKRALLARRLEELVSGTAVEADSHLVAYVVPRPGAGEEMLKAVQQELREQLPPYMIPAAFVSLDRLPRTPGGKIDRRLLAEMPPERPAGAAEGFLAPRNETERALAALWTEVLGVEQIAVDDHFFSLGGHSLLVAKLLSRIRERLHVELPLRSVFEKPVLAEMAERIESLRVAAEPQVPPLLQMPRTGPLPLSFAQQRLWFLDRLEPGSPAYNVPDALRVTGRLQPEIWDRALSEIVRRHESLRTTFALRDGEPIQVIGPPEPVTSAIVDLRFLEPRAREAEAHRRALEEAQRPFDLERGPLLRSRLLRLAGEEWLLLLTMHHIVSDGWSTGVLIMEMRELYSAFSEGRPSQLPELPIQYADFAVWQRGWLRGEVLDKEIVHWRGVLAGAPPALDLPTDHPRPAVQSFRGGQELLEIAPAISRSFADLVSREGATFFMGILAAFQVLLARYSNARDFNVGSPISGRNRIEIEGLIGFFVNTLVLRADLSGEPDFPELLSRVRARVLDAYTHQEVPFELLVDNLAPQRDLSRSALFQVLLVLQNAPLPDLELPGVSLAPVSVDNRTAKFDLTLTLVETGGRLRAGLRYNADLFEGPTARRLLQHFVTLVGEIASDPRRPVWALPLLAPGERQQLLVEWNDTARGVVNETLHGLFVEQARRTPEAAALCFEGEGMTFGELDRRSNRVARFLRSLGVGPDVLVGLCMERSLELVVGVLGILKAGGGYVPLDPGYPPERLAYMLEDSGAPVLLSQERLAGRLPASAALRVLLDAGWERIAVYGAEELPDLADTDHLACVLYTSGSTGRPKGVMDSHRCVINQLRWLQSTYELDGTDRVLQKTPISWDVSLWELFWPLSSGACMVLAIPGGHQDPAYMAATIARERITTVHFVPSMLRIFLESESGESCRSLRRVVSSGEALGLDLEEKFFASFPVDLNNMYGPGESARTTLWRCERGNTRAIAPIGRPTHGTQVYVLDRRLEPVPVGVAGELWVASQSMARGYHLRPDLTAEKFLPNPFGVPGTRLYRTGDLGRSLPDGTLEFLGRIDHQVKIRGVRIELGEIETALGQHPEVSDAVVVARPAGSGEKRLAAYVVPEGGPGSLGIEELREHLRSQLPDYMVPESWVMLAALPLAPNGKVDRDRLPEPEWVVWQGDYVAPRTPVEELLATVWAELLGLERVGVQDSFFELGGNSLLATQVASRVRSVFGVEMPLRRVFERPTLAELAAAVSELLRREHASVAPPLVPVPRTGPLPLSFAQQRLWFLERLQPGGSAYNIPNALRVTGELRPEIWDGALTEIARRHESLRTTFAWRNGEPVQVIGPPEPVTSAIEDLSSLEPRARKAEARRLALEEAQRPFDLERGPMLRSRLLRLADREWLLLLTMHHIASDGWSTGVLIRELRELYEAFAEGRPPGLPDLPIQYADFAVWQRGWLRGEVLEREIAHWRSVLADAPPALDLPTDRPRPAVQSFQGGQEALEIDPEISLSFTQFVSRQGATLFMGALAAFQVLLARYSHAWDFCVGSPISGRNRLEIEGLIGFFVNTLVLRADLSGEPDVPELLRRVRARVLDAYSHQDVPFELLVDDLASQRDLSRSPLFQVLLLVQDAPLPALKLPGISLEPLSLDSGTAKFDLTLSLIETGGQLRVGLEYAEDLFEAATARRLLQCFAALLGGVASDPHRSVWSLSLLAPGERQQLLAEWNDTEVGRREPRWIHELIEAQVRRTPDATALVWRDLCLSYRELNQRANRLAHHLRRHGVGPESRVGVSLERGPEMIVALLATLKAGGAYVPIDPSYPAQRLAWILENAQAEVLLTRRAFLERLSGFTGWAFCFETDSHMLEAEPEVDPAGWRLEHQLAYVLYTSGSTGRPKGVLLEHGGVVALLDWAAGFFAPEELAGVLGSTSINFDVSVFEIFFPLTRGGKLLLAEDPLALPELSAAGEVTLVSTVPSAMAELVRSGGLPPSVRTVNLGGEPLPRTLAEDLHRDPVIRRVYNLYGPTEDTTYSTWALIEPGEPGAPSIGRPIAGSQLYLVDPRFQPVLLGAAGEIVLGGSGLARGYLGRPDLTAERFIPNPFAAEPGSRLYRTGDLARFLPDGRVAFLGRIDHQVKIRGFRIELGEIEAVLREHPEVEDAVVIARDSAGGPRLLAYAVPKGGRPPEMGEVLRGHMAERLPAHMIPSAIVVLDELPHTPNGKVDRRALPEPGSTPREAAYIAPRTPAEELIAGVWAEVLGVPRVGAEDNFFELGGHSLLATRVTVRLRDACGMDLPLRRLFETPTVAGLARQVETAWMPGRQALQLRRRSAVEARLSFAQERLWFLQQLDPASPAYNIPSALQLTGALGPAVLERTLSELVRRHENLRTTFEVRGGEPVQVIHSPAPVPLPVVDLAALPSEVRAEAARRLTLEESRRPFDLATGPVIRASLLRLGAEEHVLLVTLHHVVSDGWSMGLLVREASALHQSFLERRPSPLPELPVQYADFAVWQREWLQGEVLERQLAWWREHLKGAPAVLDLPADRARPAVRSSRGGRVAVRVPPEVARALAAFGRVQGATQFMLYMAAFQILLARLAGREELVVGTPIAGRVRAELEDLIGLFLNTLALRGDLSGNPTFGEHLGRVREAALGAYAHQDLPFERLVEELAPERNLTHAPVFQVLFVFQNTPPGTLELPGLTWSPLEGEAGAAKFDLTLTLFEEGDGVVGSLGFHRDLFDETTVRRWCGHLSVLLAGLVREPEKRLAERELLSAAERHQILLGWNDTARRIVHETLHGLFVEQARRTPEAAALCFEGEEMTFGELDRRSNQVARFLRRLGVGPDVLVGLCMERSLELVVGVLGILKAGGGYVPLDPGYPPERLAYMLEDSGAPVLLGQERLIDRMPAGAALRVLLDADWEQIAVCGAEELPELADTDHLACVLYTSGSTGRPKGVMDSHRSVINQLRWLQSTYELDGTDRVLQKTPISWDVSLWELFWPLSSGACMVLAIPGGHQDPVYMAATIAREGITTVHFVPSMLRIFLESESESGESCGSLRRVVSSGEALGLDLEEKFFASFPVDLNNMYGPGESARTTLWRCERGNTRAIAPIGRPTHDTQVYVLDRRLEPVPVGVAGELWVASQSMARGYHLRPDLTAERFLPNPFGAPGTRLYRTGDLGRTLPDGTLEFLGRIDHQVKIRGVRIELGEIETALGQHPGVADAVVVARPAGSGEKRLAAYVVPEGGPGSLGIEELREHLRSQLPDYMVPESWVMLAALPLAPNGKVDRDLLPEPEWAVWQGDYVAPRTPVEELLATVWSELLGVEKVGVQDSFFELGGNSLLATQVASRVRSVFGVEMPLRRVFERPTLAELAAAVSELLRRERGPAALPLLPVPRTGPLPLSFAQQRLWFLHQLDPASPAYNLSLPLRLRGGLDVAALSCALNELLRRQESLRTVFETQGTQVLQRIEALRWRALPLVDLGALAEDQREREAERLAGAEAARPFDLVRGPVLRTLLVRLGETDHVFVFSQHHIVSDGWSTGIFIREMTALYLAFAQGKPSPLPELPIQYADFAVWQREWLSGIGLEEELGWWRDHLQGAPGLLEMPLDRPRPPVQTFSGGYLQRELPSRLASRLRELARREGATVFMALLALFEALLLRHTGQSDFVLGSPIANRNRSETEGLIGFFVNTLALRCDVTGNPGFRQLLARVREATLGAFTHQDLPFEKLVEELQPERNLSHTPLFQVMFSVASPAEAPSFPGLTLEALPLDSGTAKFDLTLLVEDSSRGFTLAADYNSDLFFAATVQRLLEHFEVLLESAVAEPDLSVAALPVMSPAERHQVVRGWNDTGASFPEPSCLHELFAEQVRRTPEAIALEHGEERLTYADLSRRAGLLARRLRRLGVGTDSLVGIAAERSLEMVVGLLGILQAGGVYVPLDPSYPAERLAYMLEGSGVDVILTQSWLEAGLPALPGHVLRLDEPALFEGLLEGELDSGATPASLAYTIYTSGSTGRPKGAGVPHRGIVNRLCWMQSAYCLTAGDRVLQKTPFSFDVSVWEFFWPLLTGARLVMAPPGAHQDPARLADLIRHHGITTLHFVPSMLHAFLEQTDLAGACRSVRQVFASGEALPFELKERFLSRLPGTALHNLYGPTEASVDVTYHACVPGGHRRSVPIGRPIHNTSILVLDPEGEPVPVGVPGELHIGGVGLARGYLGRPGLTAGRFIPDAFGGQPGARLYRTGDLARFRQDGEVEFLGRLDFQVKIRGVRIELGEIEAALGQHPAVRETVVVARQDGGDVRLVAYLVPGGDAGDAAGAAPEGAKLRDFLRVRLPEAMIPSAFVILPAFPLNPSGKVDRKALPTPQWTGREDAFVAPGNPVEELIASVWTEVLGLSRVGAGDNFFELGGHSLLATQVASRMRTVFGVEMPLRTVFERPTLAELAAAVSELLRREGGPQAPPLPLRRRSTTEPRLSFAQERLWFLHQLDPASPAYNIPSALQLTGALVPAVLERTLSELVRRHENLRTTFEMRGGEPVQAIHSPTPVPLPMVDLAALPSEVRAGAVRRLAAEESSRPFDLMAGPLLRASLLHLGPEEHVLLVTMHHVVSDGWSSGVLVREASALYQAFLEGRPSPLPELPVQYADFAVWQREWLQGEVLERQLAWWRNHLAGAPAVLDLPADRARPAVRSSRGGRVAVRVPPEVARALAAFGRIQGATPFMLYMAAFQILLARLAGREDLVVGTPIAGRVRAELEDLIGLFLNTLALRGDLSGDPTFGEHLGQVREAALGAYAHQDLPFERLVVELAPERNLTHAPVFQVLFVFQNTPPGALELPGLTWSPLEGEAGAAKFDLTLMLFEEKDGVVGHLGFHRDLFDEATVRRWSGHLGVLLEGLVREPEKRLAERELLSAAERHQILLGWNDTARKIVHETLHGLFVEQARRTPEAAALCFEGEEMAFGELDRRSNQVARFLRSLGVGPDVLVGLCMERSLELVVGVLGILKAGGGYVPLDPGYPPERLAYMLEDSGAPVLLSQERLAGRLPASDALRVLLDADWERIAVYSAEELPELADTDHLACVLYTSGSTGRPKGVMDSHRCVINQLLWLQSTYRLDGTDRVLQKTPISWDVSLWELFWPLSSGACMVLAIPGGHQDPVYMAATIAREKITTVHFVPSMLRIFLESESGESCGSLRRVVSSGEALGLDLEEKFFASFPVDLNNMYGPGESARTTLWRCERGNTRAIAPIGRPTHDTQVYVLDRRLEPVPVGVAGELWVASQSMARGYHLRPDLTAEKFLPNPFGAPGTRLYRTGDLARTLPDGTLEFLGRIDHQVKIRGVRIELGEIETALGQHPQVSDAVVVARPVGSGEKRLAAYVVPEGGPESVSVEELREHLRSQLPDYMVPESWVMLAALPLAPNGKVDRDRLPEPEWVVWQGDYVAPRTPVEELLATVWTELLGLERVGVQDSFFELGGNSLLATQVASRVRSLFGVEMPLRRVFERPTLAELAAVVSELLRSERGPAAPPLVPVPRTGPLPLSFAQQRIWFLHQLDPASPAYNIPNALRLKGALVPVILERALSEIVRRQESLRTVFEIQGRQVLQRIEAPRPVALPLVDLGALAEDQREKEAERLARAEAARPFDLVRGPVLRTLLVRLGETDHVFVLSQHHVVSDGWSMGIFIREMTALYLAFAQGKPSPLPELPIQYADFAVWQREWLSGRSLEEELDWWRDHLKGAPGLLEMPLDRPRPPVQTFNGGYLQRELPASLATGLRELARREGATVFMALLALFEALLLRHTGQSDFVLGSPIANRNRSETEGLIGFFVNTLALRCDVTGSPSFRQLLARVREATLGAFTHQDLPFEKLVEELQPERNLSHTPLFQVVFSVASPAEAPSFPGLTLEALPLDGGTAKVDLTLLVEDSSEGLTLAAGYNSDLFFAATVQRLLEHFEVLLESAVTDPDLSVAALAVMSPAERHQVVREWNETGASLILDSEGEPVPIGVPGELHIGGVSTGDRARFRQDGEVELLERPDVQVKTEALPAPQGSGREKAFVAPRNPLEQAVAELVAEVLGIPRVGVEEPFFDLGGNSLQAAILWSMLETRLGVTIPLAVLFEAPNVAGLARYLAERSPEAMGRLSAEPGEKDLFAALPEGDSPLVPIQPHGSRPPLFFVHAVGGTVFSYAPLARALGPDQPVYGLQSVGLIGGREPLSRIEEMAESYLAAARSVQPRGPYHLAGWSMGGAIAYEMARQLTAAGEEVAALVLLDSSVPEAGGEVAELDEADVLSAFARDLAGLAKTSSAVEASTLREVEPEQRLPFFLEHAQAAGILPADCGVHQLRQLLRVFSSNVEALRHWNPQHPYPGEVVLVRPAAKLAKGIGDGGWERLATRGVRIWSVDGDHYSLLRDPDLARRLGQLLAEVSQT